MTTVLAEGQLRKMVATHGESVAYALPVGTASVDMVPLLGQRLRLEYAGQINCIECGRATKKSFSQGYCYPCFQTLAACDSCIMSPEKCHYDAGTCREPAWGESNCMIDHVVYLANTSTLKVGITRHSQVPTRWMDQGAVQALPVFRVQTRYQSGLVETVFKEYVSDRTAWQAMLKGQVEELDMPAQRERLYAATEGAIDQLQQRFGLQAISRIPSQPEYRFNYPVLEYPTRVKSHNLDKQPVVEGTLQGIKGQYLMFDTGVINMRKYGGYHLALSVA